MLEARLLRRISGDALEERIGKILTKGDIDMLVVGPTRLLMPNGKPLLIYLPGAIPERLRTKSYPVLHKIRGKTDNRGLASGSARIKMGGQGGRTRSKLVSSSILGAMEAVKPFGYCRITAFSAREGKQYEKLFPLFQFIGEQFANYVPDRFQAQMHRIRETSPEWVVPGTPFSTITVNNSYPTGVHTDKGDLDEGFSTLACLRRGKYTGGQLVFPEWRVGVDMQDGDLLLMDAHQFHGNLAIRCRYCLGNIDTYGHQCSRMPAGAVVPERISIVSYLRTRMTECGTMEDELEKAARVRTRLDEEETREAELVAVQGGG